MRVLLNNEATVKALAVEYSATSIKISGRIPQHNPHGIEHEHYIPPVQTPDYVTPENSGETKDDVAPYVHVPEHSFDPPPIKDTVQHVSYEDTADDIVFEKVITFDELKATPGFACYTQFTFGVEFTNGALQFHEVFNRTKSTKSRAAALEKNHHYIVAILVPCAAVKSFDDCLITIHCAKEALTTNAAYTIPAQREDWYTAQPQLKVAGSDGITAAGGLLTLTYAWGDGTPIPGAEIHAEETAGYVNRKRVHTDKDGKAYFTVIPMALDKGENFRVKFGFKHFTGKVEKKLTVS